MKDLNRVVNVLYIETGTLGGGSFNSLLQHLSVIDRKKYKPIIFCFNDTPITKLWIKMGISVYVIHNRVYSIKTNNIFDLIYKTTFNRVMKLFNHWEIPITKFYHRESIKEIKRFILSNDISIVHLNVNIYRDLFGLIATQGTGAVCISHLRSNIQPILSEAFVNFVNKHIKIFIANSKATKNHWESLGLSEQKIKIIHNIINDKKVKQNFNIYNEHSIPGSFKRIIGCVASMYPVKGQKYLLDSFSELIRESNIYYLIIVGDGAMMKEIELKIQRLKIKNSVLLAGYKDNAMDYIKSFDVLIVPSKQESFGRTIIEGMALKTPVIATNVGGIPELIKNRKTGLLIEYGNTKSFLHAIKLIFENETLRSKIINNAYTMVKSRFSIKNYMKQIYSVYELK